ncbi:MAG: hypothetical protein GY874_17765 [Desulfobacteraceae bacterium]|nr:hypothetical protein [Desulfobacteraceae bacterium]
MLTTSAGIQYSQKVQDNAYHKPATNQQKVSPDKDNPNNTQEGLNSVRGSYSYSENDLHSIRSYSQGDEQEDDCDLPAFDSSVFDPPVKDSELIDDVDTVNNIKKFNGMKLQQMREKVQNKINSLNTNYDDYKKNLSITAVGIAALEKINDAQKKLENDEEISTATIFQIDEIVKSMSEMIATAEPPRGLYS